MYHALCPSLAPLCLPLTCLPSPHTQGALICKSEHFQVSFQLVSLLHQHCFAGALGLLGRLKSSVFTNSFLFIFSYLSLWIFQSQMKQEQTVILLRKYLLATSLKLLDLQ